MRNIAEWILSVIASLILLQTLFFKFTAHPESVYIFTTVGMEPWGRIGSGVVELVASICMLIPRFRGLGALIGLGVISGAILSHLTILGIAVNGDGGLLFYYACIVFISCGFVFWWRKNEVPVIGKLFSK